MSREVELRRNLTACVADGGAFSVMVGIGETYVPAFVLALGMGHVAAGLVATLPVLAGGLLQLLAPRILARLSSPRTWVVGAAVVQGLSFVPLVVVALRGHGAAWEVFLPVTIYWAFGLAGGPAWNQWVEKLFPRSIRPNFFARRSRLNQFTLLAGLVAGGLTLRQYQGTDSILAAFAALFAVAVVCRLVSAGFLAMQSATPTAELRMETEPTGVGRWSPEVKRLVGYLLAVQVGVYIAGPYFTPYMLSGLELNYGTYMFLLCCGFGGKILAFPLAGRLAKRFGPHRLLKIGGAAIVPISGCWFFGDSWWYLAGIQVLSGITWACFELGMFLMFLEAIPQRQRVGVLTWYNLGNAAAMGLGSLIGAVILQSLGATNQAFVTVFLISSLARAAALLLVPGRTSIRWQEWSGLVIRTLSVRPGAASVDRPIVASLVPVRVDANGSRPGDAARPAEASRPDDGSRRDDRSERTGPPVGETSERSAAIEAKLSA